MILSASGLAHPGWSAGSGGQNHIDIAGQCV